MAATTVSSAPPLPSSAPAPGMNQRRTSSGIFHNVKRAVFGPNKSAIDDSEFKAAQDDFAGLNQQLTALRANLAQYSRAASTLVTSARATTNTFADILKDTARPNAFSDTLLTSSQAHNELAERMEGKGLYSKEMLSVVEQQMDVHKTILARIEERIKLRTDWLYYQKKMEGLMKEREERQTKGKAEKPAEIEKLERNNLKLTDSGDRYRLYNAELLHDLQMLYISRLKTYGPCLKHFVTAEKRFSHDYYHCMQSVDREEAGARLSDGLSINVNAAADQRIVLVPAEHSPMIDQQMGLSPENPFDDVTPSPIGGLTPTNVMRANGSAAASSFSSAAATQPRHTASDHALPPSYSYPYEQHNNSGVVVVAGHSNQPAASAPMLTPPYQQPFVFDQLQWPEMGEPSAVAAGGPRADAFSDPFANAAVNPFDDLNEFSAAAAAPSASNHSSSVSYPSSRPASFPSSVPEYQPAPYVHPPAAAPAAVAAPPPASVPALSAGEIEAALGEEDGETDEDAEGGTPGELGEEEPEGVPSASVLNSAAAAAAAPAPAAAISASAHPPPAAAPVVYAAPPSSFAVMHSAAAPRVPAVPGRLPTSLPPSQPASRPAPPTSKPVQFNSAVSPPRSPASAEPDNPFDDDD